MSAGCATWEMDYKGLVVGRGERVAGGYSSGADAVRYAIDGFCTPAHAQFPRGSGAGRRSGQAERYRGFSKRQFDSAPHPARRWSGNRTSPQSSRPPMTEKLQTSSTRMGNRTRYPTGIPLGPVGKTRADKRNAGANQCLDEQGYRRARHRHHQWRQRQAQEPLLRSAGAPVIVALR